MTCSQISPAVPCCTILPFPILPCLNICNDWNCKKLNLKNPGHAVTVSLCSLSDVHVQPQSFARCLIGTKSCLLSIIKQLLRGSLSDVLTQGPSEVNSFDDMSLLILLLFNFYCYNLDYYSQVSDPRPNNLATVLAYVFHLIMCNGKVLLKEKSTAPSDTATTTSTTILRCPTPVIWLSPK